MHRHHLILLISLALLLSACGTSGRKNTQNNLYILSGKVIGYNGGDAGVEALWNDDSYGTGHIKADGNFSIALENPIDNSRLTDLESEFNPEDLCSRLNLSSNSKGTVLPILTVTKNSKVLGHLGQVSSTDMISSLQTGIYTTLNGKGIGRVYANQPTTINGMCQDAAAQFDLNLATGWNAVYLSADGKGHATMMSTGAKLDWYFLAQE
jgi:hypothetical protein